MGTVELFNKKQSHHLVGKRHGGELYFLVSPCVEGRGKAIGPPDNKNQSFVSGQLLLVQVGREAFRRVGCSILIEQYHPVGGFQGALSIKGFGFFLLLLTQVFTVFGIVQTLDAEFGIVL